MHFKEQFMPPAPFEFVIVNNVLQTEQNKDFTLLLKTKGKIVPENVMIFIDDESYFMESVKQENFNSSSLNRLLTLISTWKRMQ